MDLYNHIKSLDRRMCLLSKKVEKLLLLQVNTVDNKMQSILNLVDSDSVEFEDLGEGKVTARSKLFEFVDDYVSISNNTNKRFIFVVTDETNNNDTSLYLYTGSELKFLQTVA